MKNICRGHSDDLLDEVIHKEITANSDKPKICKAQQSLTGSSKGDLIGAENSATLPSCAQGFYLHFTICELGPKHWSDYYCVCITIVQICLQCLAFNLGF